jgi:23S rRNA pseudouridine1911/1915/1917 synthase
MQSHTLIADLESSERADKYLHALFQESEGLTHLSRSQIQKLIESGAIRINGETIDSKSKIRHGSEITVQINDPTPIEVLPENIPIQILFEDEHLIVVNKQPGLTVHPSDTQVSGTLVNALLYHVKNLSGIGGKLRPGIVHRIDKDTSGAIVISKDDLTHQGLSKLFATHDIQRKYWALTYGSPKWDQQTLKTTIGRSPNDRKKMAVNVADGREAISHFTRLEEFSQPGKHPFASLIEARLQTGRTHQVRVHLTHLGHSLLGDPVYGNPSENQAKWKNLPLLVQQAVESLPGQALHARVLGFIHPITKKELFFEAEPYSEFFQTLQSLRTFG